MKRLSIIIPCHNEEGGIGLLLSALARQSKQPDEVLVVDSASTDNTAAAARKFADVLPLTVIKGPIGVARARNAGAAHARGEWLVFLDADVTIDPRFVAQLLKYLSSRPKAGLMGFHFYARSPHWYDHLMWGTYYWYCRAAAHTPFTNFAGFGIIVRRAAHEAVGGFNPALTYSEDTDYALRIRRSGVEVRFLSRPRLGVSMRRMDRDGRLNMVGKYITAELLRIGQGGKVKQNNLDYKFGGYKRPTKKD